MNKGPGVSSNESAAVASSGASPSGGAVTPSFIAPTPGENGAQGKAFLKGKAIVVSGRFAEVHGKWTESLTFVKQMLTSFGADVKQKFSKHTSESKLVRV